MSNIEKPNPKLPPDRDLMIVSINGGPDKIYSGKHIHTDEPGIIEFEFDSGVDGVEEGDDFDISDILGPDEVSRIP